MAQKPVSMSLIKQIEQLRSDGVPIKEIARRTGMSKNTVKKYLRRMEGYLTGNQTVEMASISDKQLSKIVYNEDAAPVADKRTEALLKHFAQIRNSRELSKTGVTRQRLWQEYLMEHPDGYQYSRYCQLWRYYNKDTDAAFHWDHKAGEFIQADFAGDKLHYLNVQGNKVACEIFIAVFPFSGLSFCCAVASQKIADFAICIREMLKYYGGVSQTILVDNLRTAVKKSDRHEPQFTDLCHMLSDHYHTTFSATRAARPTDKGMAERTVNIVYQQIYAPLRKDTFRSLEALNRAIREKLEALNRKPYKGSKESRLDIFIRAEQPLLKPLPKAHYELMKVKYATVQRNYYIQLPDNKHYYSVPYPLVGKKVMVYFNASVVEVYHRHERVSLHTRRSTEPLYNRIHAHMPPNHQAVIAQKGWTVQDLLQKAGYVGPHTQKIAERIIHSSIYPEQNFKACHAMIMLSKPYSKERLEAACLHASAVERPTLRLIRTILQTGQDKASLLFDEQDKALPAHENIRGKDYYR